MPRSATEMINNAAEAILCAWSAGLDARELNADPCIMEFCQQMVEPHLRTTIRRQAHEKVAVVSHAQGADTSYVQLAQRNLITTKTHFG